MKLKNTLLTSSFLIASSTSMANSYICEACPAGTFGDGDGCQTCEAGTYSQGASAKCTTCKAGTYATAGSSECKNCLTEGVASCDIKTGKTISCKAGYGFNSSNGTCTICAAGTYSAGGKNECQTCDEYTYSAEGSKGCTALTGTVEETLANYTTGGQYTSGKLEPGYYIVALAGGDGAAPSLYDDGCGHTLGSYGGKGAKLRQLFKVDETITYTIGSGDNGSMQKDSFYCAGGGGGGSWLVLGDGRKFIAGGGGGGVGGYPSRKGMSSQGGIGGAIGGGGGSGDWYGSCHGSNGGGSGEYTGGAGGGEDRPGSKGEGEGGGAGGWVDKIAREDDDHVNVNNTYGGAGAYTTLTMRSGLISQPYSYDSTYCSSISYLYVKKAGNGSASHQVSELFSVDKNTFCSNSRCAKLFKIK